MASLAIPVCSGLSQKAKTKINRTTFMNTITTEEFFLACWLHSNAIPLTGHIRENNKSTFTFHGDLVENLLNDYYQGSATVNVTTFSASIRQLKALMYNGTTIQPNNPNDISKKGAI